ncbi:MAG: class I SAM-dependent rRNA methyltransferase [Bacteriovoracaceae bacterium]
MRILNLNKNGFNKLKANHRELKVTDLDDSIKSIPPGAWCFFKLNGGTECWFGFVNPRIEEKYSCIQVLGLIDAPSIEKFSAENYISTALETALNKRRKFKRYNQGARLVYGSVDGLPGLILDCFTNAAIIQINTAGLDQFRDLINEKVSKLLGCKSYFLDNPKYREKEFLPTYEVSKIPSLEVEENGLKYFLRSEVIQKVGFYYDHRENRLALSNILERLDIKKELGIDLFCYAGSWGLNALKGGASYFEFVDQGDFAEEVEQGLRLNQFQNRGQFIRKDVFKYLDELIASGKKYNMVLCDPPAFAKSQNHKTQALEGYSKLHRKVFKIAAPGSLCVFSSCTHYVSHEEFQKNILDAAAKENKKVQLLYTGIQGWDHPIQSLEDKSNYIKSYFYLLE